MSQRSEPGVQNNMWDNDDNEYKPRSLVISNRWQGEDEDLDVKDSWDEPEDEKKEEEEEDDDASKATAATTKKSKKALLSKIEEKEKKRREELERKKQEKNLSEMTPEELQAEKLRRQKLQEEADLVVAKELLGATDFRNSSLESQEDFEKFKDDIVKQLGESTKNQNFPFFVEQLVQSLCVHLTAADLKKIHTWIGNLQIEKLKIEKGDKSKKNKGKGKAKLKLEGDKDYNEFSAYTEDYDDFM